MTVANSTRRVLYLGDGTTTVFPVPFRFLANADLKVVRAVAEVETVLTLNVDYTVAGAGLPSGGSVTMTTAPVALSKLLIKRETAREQPVDFTPFDPFPAETQERGLDRGILISQEDGDETARSLRAPDTETVGAGFVLPQVTARAGKFLGFDALGAPMASAGTGADAGLRTDLAAGGGSALAGHNDDGTGAQAWSVRGRLNAQSFVDAFVPASELTAVRAGTSVADLSLNFGNAVTAFSTRAIANLGPGQFRINAALGAVQTRFRGQGPTRTRLRSFTSGGAAVTSGPNTAWDFAEHADLMVTGASGAYTDIGFRIGSATYALTQEYSGRQAYRNVTFEWLDKAIERRWGNIGQWVDGGIFNQANYHLWTKDNDSGSGDVMHGGCSIVTRSHFQLAEKAADYIKSATAGTGQIIRQNNIYEQNPGWVHYFATINGIGPMPGVVIENEWNEANYTAGSVTVEGDTGAPRWAKFGHGGGNVPSVTIKNTPMGPIVANGSAAGATNVLTRDCPLDDLTSVTFDTNSTLNHYHARQGIGHALGLVWSIGAVQNANALNSPVFTMPRPVGLSPFAANVVRVFDGQAVIAFTGSALVNTVAATTDPAMPNRQTVQDLTLTAGQTLFPSSTFTVPTNSWLVLQYVARLVSGPVVTMGVNGTTGLGGVVSIRDPEYKMYTAIISNTGAAITGQSFYHYAGASTSVVRIAGIALTSFTSAQEALEYANSRMFPSADRPAYTISNPTPTRTIDPATATTRQIADFLATLAADARLGQLPR